jgi:polyphosphate kinase
MYRNLSKRIELVTPVFSMSARQSLWECLDICLRDRRQAWELDADGAWRRAEADADSSDNSGTHQLLMDLACERAHLHISRKGNGAGRL